MLEENNVSLFRIVERYNSQDIMQYFAILSPLNHLSSESPLCVQQNLFPLLVSLVLKDPSSRLCGVLILKLVFCKAWTFRMVEETIAPSGWDHSDYGHELNVDR